MSPGSTSGWRLNTSAPSNPEGIVKERASRNFSTTIKAHENTHTLYRSQGSMPTGDGAADGGLWQRCHAGRSTRAFGQERQTQNQPKRAILRGSERQAVLLPR